MARTSISNLPNELLLNVFSHFVFCDTKRDSCSISLTCRHWYKLNATFLYKALNIEVDWTTDLERVYHLGRLFLERPGLTSHVQYLNFDVRHCYYDGTDGNMDDLRDIFPGPLEASNAAFRDDVDIERKDVLRTSTCSGMVSNFVRVVLSQAKALKSLRLSAYDNEPEKDPNGVFEPAIWGALANSGQRAFQSLEEVYFEGEVDLKVVAKFMTLQSVKRLVAFGLKSDGDCLKDVNLSFVKSFHLCSNVRELELEGSGIHPRDLQAMLCATKQLKILRCQAEHLLAFMSSDFPSMISTLIERLKSVEKPDIFTTQWGEFYANIRPLNRLVNLRHFVCDSEKLIRPYFYFHNEERGTAELFPQSLETLEIRLFSILHERSLSVVFVLGQIFKHKEKSFPNLRQVIFPGMISKWDVIGSDSFRHRPVLANRKPRDRGFRRSKRQEILPILYKHAAAANIQLLVPPTDDNEDEWCPDRLSRELNEPSYVEMEDNKVDNDPFALRCTNYSSMGFENHEGK